MQLRHLDQRRSSCKCTLPPWLLLHSAALMPKGKTATHAFKITEGWMHLKSLKYDATFSLLMHWLDGECAHASAGIFVNFDVMHSVLLSAGNAEWHKVIWVELAFSTMSRKVSGWFELSLERSDSWSIALIRSLMCFVKQWDWACPSWKRPSNFPAFHDVLHVCWGACLLTWSDYPLRHHVVWLTRPHIKW